MTTATKFRYFAPTTKPLELSEWTDVSWHMDASASCILRHKTKKHPRGGFVLWVQADEKSKRRLPDQPTYQLDIVPDVDNQGGKSRTLLLSDDLTEILKSVKENSL